MTYVISDIHGNYRGFKELLDKIHFSDKDVMYVLGDIVDFGDEPIELLCDLSMRYNILSVLGERDYRALKLLGELDRVFSGENADPDTMAEVAAWIADGGKSTVEGFKALDADMREGVLDYLADMALYEEVSVGSQKYVLVHAGIADFDSAISLDEYMPEDFISEPLDPDRRYFDDATIIVGHTPTSAFGGGGKIVRGASAIFIDCGSADGTALGCLRLEDGEEFYV